MLYILYIYIVTHELMKHRVPKSSSLTEVR